MGQHKNSVQIEIFVKFMEQHPDLARGFVHGDRVYFEQLWVNLTNELNAQGPPTKTVQGWKKVWSDMKLNVKQRLAHNRVEVNKTGGGRFNKYILTSNDELIATICGLYASVDGVENTKSFGAPQKKAKISASTPVPPIVDVVLDQTASTSSQNVEPQNENIEVSAIESLFSRSSTPTTSQVCPRKRKRNVMDVEDVIKMETEQFSKISNNITLIKDEVKENRTYLREISKNLREMKKLKEKEIEEMKRHNYEIEKSLQTKNELKLKFLELEQLKLGL